MDSTNSNHSEADAALFNHLIDGIKDYAIFMIDLGGKIVSWNPGVRRLLGYEEHEFLGKSFSEIFTTDDQNAGIPDGELSTAKKDGKAEDERWHLKKDGSQFWANGLVTFMKGPDGTPQGFAKIMRDQTMKKQFEEKLAEQTNSLAKANKELAHFAGVVSHDLNAPLQSVVGFAHVLQKEEGLSSDAEESVQQIVDGTKRMLNLVNELLQSSTQVKTQDTTSLVDTNKLMKEVLANLSATIAKTNASIHCEELPNVWSDATQLRRIFQNLVENALKYTRKDCIPQIKISARTNSDETIFSVGDNGQGIEAKDLSRLFTLFERASHDKEVTSRGIGLATCKQITEDFGGRMWVESIPHVGSTFSFSLPLERVHATPKKIFQYGDNEMTSP